MEVFSVFATLSLVDMISGPLGRITRSMNVANAATAGLGERLGNLALAMGPAAVAAGLLVGAFGMAASKAMRFESAMADVAKVVNFDTAAEFREMNKTVMDMAGRIPMAADGIAAIIAAAGQSGVAKEDLTEFAEQAAKMGVAFDLTGDQAGKMMADWRAGMALSLPQTYALADAVNHLSNNMNATAPALGEVIQRVGAAAMSCGLAETQVAALGAAFLSAGASPEVAATALKSFTTTLVKGTAMSKNQAAAFRSLGFSATQMAKDMQRDAQGTIFKVLQALADKPRELQMSLLTEMFGQESLGAIAPLLKNMGNLSQAFELVGNKANYAGSMQAEFDTRSKTTENALQLLSNKLTNLAIAVGNAFLPAITAGAKALGAMADALRWVAETRVGQVILTLAGGLAAAVLAVTAFSAGMWAVSKAAPVVSATLTGIRMALLALGWPVWALIAAVGLLYVAYKKNFGGIATTLNRWGRNISLVVRGVTAIFESLKGSTFEIRGELARDIRAAELAGLWPWFTPDGVLKVAAPDYGRAVDAELILDTTGTKNNVLDLSLEDNCQRRWSEVTVLGQGTGDEHEGAQPAIKAVARDAEAGFSRPLIRDAAHLETTAQAQARANKLLSDSIFESWQAVARVRGHRTDSGAVWEPGMHIRLLSPPLGLDVDTMLARRTLSCDRQGGTVSTLYLRPWALWLPDTAPKARRKHHKKGGDCCTCDLCAG
ncbi:phage tail tape measure protein [Desulfovibrio sp.]|uniref:phage tail tape measure protein n=1 Tax=Desulfovibrio sp. TaxID=885 RepID=UPI003AF84F53